MNPPVRLRKSANLARVDFSAPTPELFGAPSDFVLQENKTATGWVKERKKPAGRDDVRNIQSRSGVRALLDEWSLCRRQPESAARYAVALGTMDSA